MMETIKILAMLAPTTWPQIVFSNAHEQVFSWSVFFQSRSYCIYHSSGE